MATKRTVFENLKLFKNRPETVRHSFQKKASSSGPIKKRENEAKNSHMQVAMHCANRATLSGGNSSSPPVHNLRVHKHAQINSLIALSKVRKILKSFLVQPENVVDFRKVIFGIEKHLQQEGRTTFEANFQKEKNSKARKSSKEFQ